MAYLGFGILRLPYLLGQVDTEKIKKMIDIYMDGKVCYFDLHPHYVQSKAEEILKDVVVKRYPRERYIVADKIPYTIKNTIEYERQFLKSLKTCGIEYFDYYLLHALTEDVIEKHEMLGGFEFIKEKKEEGAVRHIGISFHDKPDILDKVLKNHPEIEFVQLQINYLDWNNPVICSKGCYEIARKYSKPIVVMEPIKGGLLANKPKGISGRVYDEKGILPKLALQFAASLPGVEIVLSGMSEPEHVIENRKSVEQSIKIDDESIYLRERLVDYIKKEERISCTDCRYCVRECPKKIDIPEIFSIMNSMQYKRNYDSVSAGRHKILYNNCITNKGKASDCIACGKCELRCLQKLPIRKLLSDAVKVFEIDNEKILEMEYNDVFDENTEMMKDLEKKRKWNYELIKEWLIIRLSNGNLEKYFISRNIRLIAVYGLGAMGELFLKEASMYSNVKIAYGIDINRKKQAYPFSVYSPRDNLETVDAIVVTAAWDFPKIKEYLNQKINIEVVSLKDIIADVLWNSSK